MSKNNPENRQGRQKVERQCECGKTMVLARVFGPGIRGRMMWSCECGKKLNKIKKK